MFLTSRPPRTKEPEANIIYIMCCRPSQWPKGGYSKKTSLIGLKSEQTCFLFRAREEVILV
jgi:hypothetical protein